MPIDLMHRNGRLRRFAVVGLAATAAYAGFASAMAATGLGVTAASVCAYLLAAIVSYAGHKYATFRSDGRHAIEGPRFLLSGLLGLGLAGLIPLIMCDLFGAPAVVAVAATCLLVPAVNYVVLDRFVFATALPANEAASS
ncbi:MAG: GtrA family protein [Rhizobiaceae bacterium]|nr:GtrA family protein [Rhizobiaceae bacterium]MCV0405666.1 GtrA family protein [Rhizobiaceae bacterium]